MTARSSATRHHVSLGALLSSLVLSIAQSPPRLSPEAFDIERVVPEGTMVQLPCPIVADPDSLFFEWYRDREPLDAFADERYRVLSNGVLRIKSAVPEDTGLYVCRAVNGFGKADVNVTLIVVDSPESYRIDSKPEDHDFIAAAPERNEEFPRVGEKLDLQLKGRPRLTQTSKSTNFAVAGSSIALKCVAKGDPRPSVSWMKNGKPLPDSNLPTNSRGGHWVLFLQNLQVSDAGNYTCIAQNTVGATSTSFSVKVVERVRSKPEFVNGYPPNVTAHDGETISLQCLLKSDVPPHVQWLKKVHPPQSVHPDHSQTTVKLLGDFYQILKSTELIERVDGSYMSKIVFKSVSEEDEGKYICLGTNNVGFSSRSAFLKVLPVSTSDVFSSPDLPMPFPLLVAVVICGAILLAGLLGMVLYCRTRKYTSAPIRDTSSAATNTTSSTSSKTTNSGHTTERKHSYVGMTYKPHMAMHRDDLTVMSSPAKMYIAPGQLHRTVPLNAILI